MTLAGWPDAERAVGDLLASLGTCGRETPETLQSALPYLRITRTGGTDDGVTDTAHVSVDVFAASADDAKAAAEQARQILIRPVSDGGTARDTAHGRIDLITTDSGPFLLPPTDSDNLRLAAASYAVTMRKGT